MPANKEKEALLDAVIDGNEGRLAAVLHQAVLLSDYINENIVDGKQTALMVAARHGRLSNVRLLVEKGGADLNAVSPSGLTALMVGCWKGHFEVVDFLLKRGADPQKTCLQGLHALIYASKYGHLRCVERLLLLGGKNVCIDKQDSARMSAYAHACLEDHPEVARALVLMGAADYSVDPHILERILARGNRECVAISEMLDGQLGLLKAAVDDGDRGRLAALVREAAPVFKRPVEPGGSKNLLMYTIQQRRTDMALLLIEERAGVDWHVRGGRTALHDACEAGEWTLVSALLEKGADLTGGSSNGSLTPLYAAVLGGHARVVTMLLTHPSFAPALWKRESYQAIWQAVQLAMQRGSAETLYALMEHGVGHLEHPGSFWASSAADVLDHSICRGTAATFLQTLNGQAEALRVVCVSGQVEEVDTQLTAHPYLLYKPHGPQKRTALMEMAMLGRVDVAKVLLYHDRLVAQRVASRSVLCNFDRSAHPWVASEPPPRPSGINVVDADKVTALALASGRGHLGMVTLLLDHGAQGFVGGWSNSDALRAACVQGHTAVVQTLLERCVEFREPKRLGEALVNAASGSLDSVFRLLLSHVRVGTGEPTHIKLALYALARKGRMAMLQLLVPLLDHEDVNVALGAVTQGLCNGVRGGHVEVVKLMLPLGADIYVQDSEGSYISLLEEQEQREGEGDAAWACLELLQDAQSSREDIVVAVEKGDVSSLEASLGHLDPQARRLKLRGRGAADATPLTMAVQKGNEAMVARLIEWGAEVDVADRNGMTPLKLAARMGRPDLIRRLCAAGALMHAVKWEAGDKLTLSHRTYDALPEAAKHVEALTALLELGAEARGKGGEVVLRGAADAGTAAVVKALLPHMGRWLSLQVGQEAVLCAVTKGHEEVLRELLLSGAEDSEEWRSLLKRAEVRAQALRRRCPLALKLAQREDLYILQKVRTIHDGSTPRASLPACLASRAELPQRPLPTVVVAAPAASETKRSVPPQREGQVDKTQVLVAVAQFVVGELKHDLFVELSELLADAEQTTPGFMEPPQDAYDMEIEEGDEDDEGDDDYDGDGYDGVIGYEMFVHNHMFEGGDGEYGEPLYEGGDYYDDY